MSEEVPPTHLVDEVLGLSGDEEAVSQLPMIPMLCVRFQDHQLPCHNGCGPGKEPSWFPAKSRVVPETKTTIAFKTSKRMCGIYMGNIFHPCSFHWKVTGQSQSHMSLLFYGRYLTGQMVIVLHEFSLTVAVQ